MKQDRLLALQNTDMEDIKAFLATRESAKIPQPLQTYILQLDTVNRLLHYNRLSVRRAIDQIRREWPELTVAQARGIYYDAIDYFYHDDSASASGWDRIYADQFDDLKLLCIQAGKYNAAIECMKRAHELRTTVREAQDFKWQAPVYYININVRPEDLGYKTQKLADIARRYEDQEYAAMINSLDTTDAEKERLMRDAGIKTVEYDKVEDPEDDQL